MTRGAWSGAWSGALAETLAREPRLALRRLARSPAFALAVILSLAVGIGADVAMLGLVDALLLRAPAHVRDADRLVEVRIATHPDYVALRDQSRAFSGVAAYAPRPYAIVDRGVVTPVQALLASASLFPTLGTSAAMGRFFAPDEDRPDGPHVAVLGYSLWQNRYGASRDVIGRAIHVAGDVYTVIGVAPEGFSGVGTAPVDLILPLSSTKFDAGREALTNRAYAWLRVVARLGVGTTLGQARAESRTIYERANEGRPAGNAWEGERPADVVPLMEARRARLGADAKVSLWLAGVATIVLLIACANVAGLVLARAVRQRHELAVRAALGASRRRIVAGALAEGAMLGIAGGALGLLVSRWAIALIRGVLLTDAAPAAPLDARALAIALGATVVTVLATGLWPALRATRGALPLDLARGTRGASLSHAGARRALVVVQVALALVLVVGAGLFTTSLRRARGLDLGMSLEPVLVANVNLSGAGYSSERVREVVPRVLERLAALPGVRAAAATGASVVPGWMNYTFSVPGRDSLPRVLALDGSPGYSAVTPGFFEMIGTPIVRGRGFTEGDRARRVIVVSERFASLYWPGENPLGRCVKVGGATKPCAEVIGVTRDRRGGPLDTLALPETFVLLGGAAEPPSFLTIFPASQIAVRVAGDPARAAPLVQSVLGEMLPDVPMAPVRPALSLFDRAMRSWRMGASLFGAFGAIAVALAMLGVYATVAYGVAQRRRELGIRMALGATPARIARLVLGETMLIALTGVAIGAAASIVLARGMSALLFGVSALSPAVHAASAVLVLCVAILAVAAPVRRSTRIEPTVALRETE